MCSSSKNYPKLLIILTLFCDKRAYLELDLVIHIISQLRNMNVIFDLHCLVKPHNSKINFDKTKQKTFCSTFVFINLSHQEGGSQEMEI